MKMKCFGWLSCVLVLAGLPAVSASLSDNPFIGHWALTIPGGGAGWLGVEVKKDINGNEFLDASILWGGGSVVPVEGVFIIDDTIYVVRDRIREWKTGTKQVRKLNYIETLMGKVDGETINFIRVLANQNGYGYKEERFSGKRIPDLPAKPDLSKVKFGEPIKLFNGQNLDGWELTNPRAVNGWSVINGALVNWPIQVPGTDRLSYGNLRTTQEFEDFNLKLEVNVPPNENSGIYLRGIYEVQVLDSYDKPLDSHNMGAIYSRITPKVNAEKPANEWQTFDITLCDRHVTVILNGIKIIDNEPLLGCTGGALWSDQFRPGPIYLQGDHGPVMYRNMVLTPIVR